MFHWLVLILDELPSVGSEIDLQFQCNDDVSEGSMKNAPLIIELGRALSSADLKSSMFF
jgi:hypothetical protein